MTTEIPSDLLPFVQRMVAARRFLSERDVLEEGLHCSRRGRRYATKW